MMILKVQRSIAERCRSAAIVAAFSGAAIAWCVAAKIGELPGKSAAGGSAARTWLLSGVGSVGIAARAVTWPMPGKWYKKKNEEGPSDANR